MSGAQTSTFAEPNILLRTLSGQQTADVLGQQIQNQQNQLLMPYRVQGAQQQVGAAEMDTMGRAAAGLLSLPDENARAAAYPGEVQRLQALGFAKNAPAQYPGEAALRTFVGQALPVEKQYELGIITAPGSASAIDQLNRIYGGGGGGTAGSGQGGAAGAGGGTTDFNYGNIRPVGATGGFNTYATPQEGVAAMSSLLKTYQTDHGITTLNGLTARWAPKGDGANDPVAYAKRLGGTLGIDPDAPINLADPMLQMRLIPAMAQVEKGRPFNQPADVLTAGIQAGLSGKGGTTVATAAAPGARGVAARTGGADVASNAPVAPATFPAPAQADLVGPRPLPLTGPGSPVATPASIANTPYPAAQNALAPQPPPAAPPAPAAVTPPPPAAPPTLPAQPAPQASLPHASEVPSGAQAPQVQQAQDLLHRAAAIEMVAAQNPYDKRLQATAAAQAADLKQRAQLLMQQDSVVQTVEGQFHPLTGKLDDPAHPNADYYWDEARGSFIDRTNTHPPVTPPSPRLTNVPGVGVVQSKPGGGAVVVVPMNPQGLITQSAATAAGQEAGKDVGKLPSVLADQGRNAAQAIGNIDYGMSQIQQAQQGGIPTGYFAPWLATAAAIGKSIGGDVGARIASFGADPNAVGNIQTAGKTLAVVSGAILDQILGPQSQITDAKIQHFIHAQPGIETDPQALNRVLNWARSQFVYEREMAAQGMKDTAASPTGTLPVNWEAQYYDKHGFAPIYNPGTGEMQQPDGSAPPREAPAAVQTAPVNPASRTAGTTYSTPKGPLKWTGTGWVNP